VQWDLLLRSSRSLVIGGRARRTFLSQVVCGTGPGRPWLVWSSVVFCMAQAPGDEFWVSGEASGSVATPRASILWCPPLPACRSLSLSMVVRDRKSLQFHALLVTHCPLPSFCTVAVTSTAISALLALYHHPAHNTPTLLRPRTHRQHRCTHTHKATRHAA
jgi:hypothetical protein